MRLQNLPDEVLQRVFAKMSPQDLAIFRTVDRHALDALSTEARENLAQTWRILKWASSFPRAKPSGFMAGLEKLMALEPHASSPKSALSVSQPNSQNYKFTRVPVSDENPLGLAVMSYSMFIDSPESCTPQHAANNLLLPSSFPIHKVELSTPGFYVDGLWTDYDIS